MNKTDKNLLREAFGASKKGLIISIVECTLLGGIAGFLMTKILIYLFTYVKPDLRNEEVMSIYMPLIMACVGAFLGSVFIGMSRVSIFCWKIFPPTESDIRKYKDSQITEKKQTIEETKEFIKTLKEDYEEQIKDNEEYVKELEKEISELAN